jgi:tRNA threonylcarbamoyladenosine biosynthesis protein TsaB
VPVLSLDTSADIAVSVVDDTGGAVLAADRTAESRRHAELLSPMVASVLAAARLHPADLTAVVVGTGPAPFTGLRAGLVTARALAFALGISVHGVCSLEALAAQAFDAGIGEGGDVVVVTDARRREVYVGRYRQAPGGAGLLTVAPPGVVHPAVLAQELADAHVDWPDAAVVGPGALLYPEHLTEALGAPRHLDPAVLARLALSRVAAGERLPSEPLYLRRPDVTPTAGSKRATG